MSGALAREVCHHTDVTVAPRATQENRSAGGMGVRVGLAFAALFVIAIFVWQGIAAQGAPNPLQANTTATVASLCQRTPKTPIAIGCESWFGRPLLPELVFLFVFFVCSVGKSPGQRAAKKSQRSDSAR